jgi:hypothetical protein
MATNIGGRFLLLAALVLAANEAAAQAPVQSFADLQPLVKPGQQVIVWGDDGRKTIGRVVSLAGNQLEIQRRRWFRGERRVFTEQSVGRIENYDSDWNGSLIGVGIGILTAVLLRDGCGENDVFCDYVAILSTPAGYVVGSSIDGAINRTLYVSPGGTRATLLPLLGRERAGLAAAIRF